MRQLFWRMRAPGRLAPVSGDLGSNGDRCLDRIRTSTRRGSVSVSFSSSAGRRLLDIDTSGLGTQQAQHEKERQHAWRRFGGELDKYSAATGTPAPSACARGAGMW